MHASALKEVHQVHQTLPYGLGESPLRGRLSPPIAPTPPGGQTLRLSPPEGGSTAPLEVKLRCLVSLLGGGKLIGLF